MDLVSWSWLFMVFYIMTTILTLQKINDTFIDKSGEPHVYMNPLENDEFVTIALWTYRLENR